MRWSKNVHVTDHPFKPVVSYNHGVTNWEPVLESEPPMKRPVYNRNGFTVVMWMVKGNLTWQPKRSPVKIGAYTVDAQVVGPEQDRIQPLIDKIVDDTAHHFNQ
jgi:hypothetical protein